VAAKETYMEGGGVDCRQTRKTIDGNGRRERTPFPLKEQGRRWGSRIDREGQKKAYSPPWKPEGEKTISAIKGLGRERRIGKPIT